MPLAIAIGASQHYCASGSWPSSFAELESSLRAAGLLDDATPAVLDEYRASFFFVVPSGALSIRRLRPEDPEPPVNWSVSVPEDCSEFPSSSEPAA